MSNGKHKTVRSNANAKKTAPRETGGRLLGVVALVGGAAVGTLAMYLLDPKQGANRRAAVRDAAQRALEGTTDAAYHAYASSRHAVGDAMQNLGHHVKEVGSTAYESLPSEKEIRQHPIFDRARELGSNAYESARSMLAHNPLRRERHSDYAMNPTGVSITALTTLAAGAGAMWLADPTSGRSRRAWIFQKVNDAVNEVYNFARDTGRRIGSSVMSHCENAEEATSDVADVMNEPRSMAETAHTGASH